MFLKWYFEVIFLKLYFVTVVVLCCEKTSLEESGGGVRDIREWRRRTL